MAHRSFSPAQQAALYAAIFERRDIRAYRPDPVAWPVLRRILDAAHHAPSVGFMQPWSFLVLEDRAQRQLVYGHFKEANQSAAEAHADERRERYMALKLQGILDAPLNVAVTCDPDRAGPNVLGRATMPETDVYSTCLAIQNLWLAARVEGVGVGWMSIMEPARVKLLLGIPERVQLVAYLTLGYPVEFPEQPMLQSVGWRKRLPLDEVVYFNGWEQPATELDSHTDAAGPALTAPGPEAGQRGQARLDELTKPRGSLGRLEEVAVQMCALQGLGQPLCDRRHLLLFAADHGVTQEGVSAYASEVTAKMVYQFIAGTAAVNALGRQLGVPLSVVDVGVDHDFGQATGLVHKKVRGGTRNLAQTPAMTGPELQLALQAGRDAAKQLGALQVLMVGEMGIGNTTSATALACYLLDKRPDELVGRGTGVGAQTTAHKARVIEAALDRHKPQSAEHALQCLGGYEIAALVGAMEQLADSSTLVVLDGLITTVAALLAVQRAPALRQRLLAGHLSTEPAHRLLLDKLELAPLLQLQMRLGEGSGALLSMGLIESACRVMAEMGTFTEAGIEHTQNPEALK